MAENERIVVKTLLKAGKFLSYSLIEWRNARGEVRLWETVDRPNAAGAVLIIARLRPSGRIVVIRQFRPPAGGHVYEFPAGLVEHGEEAEAAARRELREETGYSAVIVRVWPAAYTTPGMASESVFMVEAVIDEHAETNQNPQTDFDESENIQTLLVPENALGDLYRRETAAGHAFDAKLAAYILALEAKRG